MLRISISRQWAKILLVLLALGLAASCEKCGQSGRPMLWKVDGKKSSYLFGTIHFPDERVLKLPASVRKALGASDAVYTEIPMDPESQMKAGAQAMLAGDQTLKEILPAELYARVEKLFDLRAAELAGKDAAQTRVAGTFSARAAEYLGLGPDKGDRIARATEKTARNTSLLIDQLALVWQ